jgi:hypothetical protein
MTPDSTRRVDRSLKSSPLNTNDAGDALIAELGARPPTRLLSSFAHAPLPVEYGRETGGRRPGSYQ